MSISTIFDIASSGVAAQRQAIEVSGENIANVNTEGYSRQQVIMVNGPVPNTNGTAIGTGVQIQTVRRAYDATLQQQIVGSTTSYQQSLAKETALNQIEPSFNELTSDGLGKAVDNFFGSWQDLSTNPQGTAERQSLLSNAQILIDTFHQVNTNLTNVASGANSALTGIAADVTDNAKNLALVNLQIISTNAVGGSTNTLLDQRDLLMQKLSEKVGITTSVQSDGTASVTLAGGGALVSGTQYATLYTNANASVPPSNNVLLSGLGNPPPAQAPLTDQPVTATVGGQLGGTLQVRDTIVPGYLSKLNDMAKQMVVAVNAQQQAGYALDGTNNNKFFDSAKVTSANIALDSTLTANKIAAGAGTNSGDNINALAVAAIQNNSSIPFSSGGATFDDYYNSLMSGVATDTKGATSSTAQGAAFLQQLKTLRSSNSGVSLDEELTNLTKYQQAFQGSAKVLNVATQMLDTILGLVS
jgi:flagellar hook-associated protein 1